MSEPVLALGGVVRTFQQGRTTLEVLRGVDLDLREGEIVALVPMPAQPRHRVGAQPTMEIVRESPPPRLEVDLGKPTQRAAENSSLHGVPAGTTARPEGLDPSIMEERPLGRILSIAYSWADSQGVRLSYERRSSDGSIERRAVGLLRGKRLFGHRSAS